MKYIINEHVKAKNTTYFEIERVLTIYSDIYILMLIVKVYSGSEIIRAYTNNHVYTYINILLVVIDG